MNTQIEGSTSKLDIILWLGVGILVAAAIVANSYFSAQPVALRLIGWLVVSVIATLMAFKTSHGKRMWIFGQEARMELRKVVWPTRQETVQTTLVVIAVVAATGLLLWGLDSILLWLVGLLTGQRG